MLAGQERWGESVIAKNTNISNEVKVTAFKGSILSEGSVGHGGRFVQVAPRSLCQ